MAQIVAPVAPHRPSLRRRLRESWGPWFYIAPAGVIMLFISFLPQLFQVWLSFTNFRAQNLRFNVFDPTTWDQFGPEFIGLQNYERIIQNDLNIPDYNFGRTLAFNLVWTFTNVFLHVAIGVGLAMLLNQKRVLFRRFYRAMFVIPWALPAYISALTWRNMFDRDFGAINQLLGMDIDWLNQVAAPFGGLLEWLPLAFYAVLLANTWLGWPFMMVVASGALLSIPSDLYEAADIDGANAWQRFRTVTVPMIRPAMVPAIMLGSIWTFNQFNVIYFISEGDPGGRTEILVTQAFKLVFENRVYGVASAFAIIVFFILLIITLAQNRLTRATESYDA